MSPKLTLESRVGVICPLYSLTSHSEIKFDYLHCLSISRSLLKSHWVGPLISLCEGSLCLLPRTKRVPSKVLKIDPTSRYQSKTGSVRSFHCEWKLRFKWSFRQQRKHRSKLRPMTEGSNETFVMLKASDGFYKVWNQALLGPVQTGLFIRSSDSERFWEPWFHHPARGFPLLRIPGGSP